MCKCEKHILRIYWQILLFFSYLDICVVLQYDHYNFLIKSWEFWKWGAEILVRPPASERILWRGIELVESISLFHVTAAREPKPHTDTQWPPNNRDNIMATARPNWFTDVWPINIAFSFRIVLPSNEVMKPMTDNSHRFYTPGFRLSSSCLFIQTHQKSNDTKLV